MVMTAKERAEALTAHGLDPTKKHSVNTIKKAYRELAKGTVKTKYSHPDKGGTQDGFTELTKSRDALLEELAPLKPASVLPKIAIVSTVSLYLYTVWQNMSQWIQQGAWLLALFTALGSLGAGILRGLEQLLKAVILPTADPAPAAAAPVPAMAPATTTQPAPPKSEAPEPVAPAAKRYNTRKQAASDKNLVDQLPAVKRNTP